MIKVKPFYLWDLQKHAQLLSWVQLFSTPWTEAHQDPLSMEFSKQEYQSGLSCSASGDLLNPGIKPWSPALQADSLPSEPPGKPQMTSNLQMFFLYAFLFWLHCAGCGILVPQPGIEPESPTLGAQSLNHWTGKPQICFLLYHSKLWIWSF